jgi:hypothetical protein
MRITIPFAALSPDDPIDFLVSMHDRQKVAAFAEDNLFSFNFYTVTHHDSRVL